MHAGAKVRVCTRHNGSTLRRRWHRGGCALGGDSQEVWEGEEVEGEILAVSGHGRKDDCVISIRQGLFDRQRVPE